MSMVIDQAPHSLLMVRPLSFSHNSETAASNRFQQSAIGNASAIHEQALLEFDRMVTLLQAHEIDVIVFEDTAEPVKPDAIFPNNWISLHEDGRVVLYPMMAENRRAERRADIVERLKSEFEVKEVFDFSDDEKQGRFLEGTGSLVFDYVNRVAYAARSPRTDEDLARQLCEHLGYRLVAFDSADEQGNAIYHTNVVMCVGSKVAVVCLDAIHSDADQDAVLESFAATGHRVVAISYPQLRSFAGNMMEVKSMTGERFILLSRRAFESLVPGQINALSRDTELLPISVETIETYSGGSVRCMVAGIYLPTRAGLRQ